MIFQKESIEAILAGRKTMTRRLVKEGEYLKTGEFAYNGWYDYEKNNEKELIRVVKNKRVKWQVGRKYAVCPGRGKSQRWYCPDCKFNIINGKEMYDKFKGVQCKCGTMMKPLFVEVTGIRKEKLLDITEEDAKREGFRHTCEIICDDDKINLYTRQNFIDAFCKIYGIGFREDGVPNQNPYTWVISFKVV
jgi:hypothetical protein